MTGPRGPVFVITFAQPHDRHTTPALLLCSKFVHFRVSRLYSHNSQPPQDPARCCTTAHLPLNSDSTASSHPLLHTHPFFQAPTLSEFSIFGLPLVTSRELFIPFEPSSVCNPLITFPAPDSRHTQHLTLYQQHSPHSPGRLNTLSHKRTT